MHCAPVRSSTAGNRFQLTLENSALGRYDVPRGRGGFSDSDNQAGAHPGLVPSDLVISKALLAHMCTACVASLQFTCPVEY